MKKRVALALMLAMCISVCACTDFPQNKIVHPIVGTWISMSNTYDASIIYSFTEESEYICIWDDHVSYGTYKLEGKYITMRSKNDEEPGMEEYEYTVDEKRLSFIGMEGYPEFYFKRLNTEQWIDNSLVGSWEKWRGSPYFLGMMVLSSEEFQFNEDGTFLNGEDSGMYSVLEDGKRLQLSIVDAKPWQMDIPPVEISYICEGVLQMKVYDTTALYIFKDQ